MVLGYKDFFTFEVGGHEEVCEFDDLFTQNVYLVHCHSNFFEFGVEIEQGNYIFEEIFTYYVMEDKLGNGVLEDCLLVLGLMLYFKGVLVDLKRVKEDSLVQKVIYVDSKFIIFV